MFKYCLICNTKIVKKVNESVKNFTNRRKFCSIKCQNEWQTSRTSWNKGLTINDDPRVARFVNAGHKAHIGVAPWNKGVKGIQIAWNRGLPMERWQKENNPNWKGGITKENEKIRKTIEYKNWRRACMERDNFTCQICLKRGGDLEIDHIKPQSLFPELRFELTNGRTLCIPCHRKTDTYGENIKRYSGTLTPE